MEARRSTRAGQEAAPTRALPSRGSPTGMAEAKRRGCKTIPCFVIRRGSKARFWREAENLNRAELNVLERAESIDKIRVDAFKEGGKLPHQPEAVSRVRQALTRLRSALA